MDKISCAVDRIDNPFIVRLGIIQIALIFFATKGMIWIGVFQLSDDNVLNIFVDISDIVVLTFA